MSSVLSLCVFVFCIFIKLHKVRVVFLHINRSGLNRTQ